METTKGRTHKECCYAGLYHSGKGKSMTDVPERLLEPPIEWQREPTCPICGAVCEKIYFLKTGWLAGCDECVTAQDAAEVEECYK